MKLLTQEILKTLPDLGDQDGKGEEAIAYVKFFTPDSCFTWWATEYRPADRMFFGLVQGAVATELGYFRLDELETAVGPFGLHIERDLYFKPMPLREARLKAEPQRLAPGDSAGWRGTRG